jgi:hypothetical protein
VRELSHAHPQPDDRDPRRAIAARAPIFWQLGIPNACNTCHGQYRQWAAETVASWYDLPWGENRRKPTPRRCGKQAAGHPPQSRLLARLP